MDTGRKSAEYRRSFDAQDRRRSVELARSTRRYDEHWGAAERADTRLKCSDNIIHHVHSQIVSCWSPVLRDMINLVPTHGLLESTHGLAYVLQVQEDSGTWAAVLDMIYPVVSSIQDWVRNLLSLGNRARPCFLYVHALKYMACVETP